MNLHAETLPDGWLLTYDSNDPNLPRCADVRRVIAGKAVWCSVNAATDELRREGVLACKSMRR
jgi:hypothetical protein